MKTSITFLVPFLLTSFLYAQEQTLPPHGDVTARTQEIEQKVLLKQYQNAVQALVGSAREAEDGETGASPEIIGKRLQWLTLVDTQIEAGGKTPAANQEDMTESVNTLNNLAWKMVTSPDAGKRNPEIALKLATIAIELSGGNEDLTPKVLDTKARALFLLGKRGEAIAEQEKAVAAATVAEEKAGFEATLATYRRDGLPDVFSPADDALTQGVARIVEKLRTIIIPTIDFEDATLDEVVGLLRKQSIELDKTELDPSRKGVNLVVRNLPASPTPAAGPTSGKGLPNPTAESGALRIKSLHLRNVPLAVALKYICDAVRFRFKVDDYAVTLVSMDGVEDIFTRTFGVPKDFASNLNSGSREGAATDRPPIIELLRSAGIKFGERSSVTLTTTGTLMVTNTPSELDKIEVLIVAMTTTWGVSGTGGGVRGGGGSDNGQPATGGN